MISSAIRSVIRVRPAVPRVSRLMRPNVGLVRMTIPQVRMYSQHHEEETFEEFTARYVKKLILLRAF